jgi:hypothetical protein
MIFKKLDAEWSHPVEVEVARVYGSWKSKRQGDGKKKNDFRIIIVDSRRACVIAIIWLGQKVGREQDGLRG